jgi:hypothetical protein
MIDKEATVPKANGASHGLINGDMDIDEEL